MRTITILTVAAIITTVLAYNFIREDAASEQPQALISQTEAALGKEDQGKLDKLAVQDKLDKLTSVLQHYQQTNQEQLQQAQLEQARLNKKLADLDTRLRSMETAGGETAGGEQATDTDVSDSGAGNPESGKIPETDLGHWMDETLHAGYRDRDLTALVTEQATESLAKVPGVILEDMQCGEDFCHATFAHENGEQPAIQDLFGEPPFVNEGFTITEADGRVSLYFTRSDVSLGELRNEAREAAQLGQSW